MRTLQGIAMEIVHLFEDDGLLAVSLIVWAGMVGLGVMWLPLARVASGPALFLGCATLLLATAIRAARLATRNRSGGMTAEVSERGAATGVRQLVRLSRR